MKTKNVINQIALFSSNINLDEIQNTLSLVSKYIDTVTWMVLHVGPIIYCEYCKSSFCNCVKFTPLVTHEQLSICDKYDNQNDAIPAMAAAFMFPLNTVFVRKSRSSTILKYLMVVSNNQGGYYLKEKRFDEIQEWVEWKKVNEKLKRRLAYQQKLKASQAFI